MPLLQSRFIDRRGKMNVFFGFMLTELFIGGAGRVFAFGGVTLRMLFFIVAMIYSLILFVDKVKFNVLVVKLTIVYALINILSITVGLINSADKSIITENFLMSSFFFTFPFFSHMIRTPADVDKVTNYFKRSAIFLALAYLGFLVLLLCNIIPFLVLYRFMENPEFAFRGQQALFYKGFLYMCCGFFFFINNDSKYNVLAAITIVGATVATFVRGFLVSMLACYLIYLSFIKNIIWGLLLAGAIIIGFPFAIDYYSSVLGDRSATDQIRVVQYHQVVERTNPFSTIIGWGYGIGVPVRPNHFEINYLEIFYKQGIIGIAFWFFLLSIVIYKFYKAKKNGNGKKGTPYLLSCLFLYIQSTSNPFLSNSMGMTLIFVSILCLDVLTKKPEYYYA